MPLIDSKQAFSESVQVARILLRQRDLLALDLIGEVFQLCEREENALEFLLFGLAQLLRFLSL